MTLLEYLNNKITEDMRMFEEDMAMGKAKDFAEYKYACGIYQGLLRVRGYVVEAKERMEGDDDDDQG